VAFRTDATDAARAHRIGGAPPTPSKANAAERSLALVKAQKRRQRMFLFTLIGGAILLGSLGTIVFYGFIQPLVKNVGQGIIDISETPVVERPGADGTAVAVVTPARIDEPINILLLGLDERPGDVTPLADTQIVVRVDPINKRAVMFSIPRDTYVKIPGFADDRINTSYRLGSDPVNDVPGGGPGLAMSTIEQNFGIRIHYHARLNFTGFEEVIDAMGGVTVDVQRPLVDNQYPLPNYGTSRIYIPAGIQHMNGKTALQYARSRHADSDIGRNSRQQQVLLALRQQGLNFDILGKLPELTNRLKDAVKTDIDTARLVALARLAQEIGPANIETFVIEPPMVYEFTTVTGASVLMPNWNLIRPKIAELFSDPKIGREKANVLVLNGTTVNGMAARTQTGLRDRGVPVAAIGSAPNQGSYQTTTVTDYTGGTKPETIKAILAELGLDEDSVVDGGTTPDWVLGANSTPVRVTGLVPADATPLDIVVTLGNDRVSSLGTPTPAVP
jgi:polyisoprenyl-teichoic acid--peptidoglycan teichoic acid transferase